MMRALLFDPCSLKCAEPWVTVNTAKHSVQRPIKDTAQLWAGPPQVEDMPSIRSHAWLIGRRNPIKEMIETVLEHERSTHPCNATNDSQEIGYRESLDGILYPNCTCKIICILSSGRFFFKDKKSCFSHHVSMYIWIYIVYFISIDL